MHIQTTGHNSYTYLRRTNEIIAGTEDMADSVWEFEPLHSFSAIPDVEIIILGITEKCNQRCTYCCYSGKYQGHRGHTDKAMSCQDIDSILDFVERETTKRPLHIGFYGGEPMTNYEVLQYAIETADNRWKGDVSFSLSTNATLLTKSSIDRLLRHDVRLDISIDGIGRQHDRQRGKGTFAKVRNALGYIKSNYPDCQNRIKLQMVIPSSLEIEDIAREWNEDAVLKDLKPSSISGIAPDVACHIEEKDYETLKQQYLHLLDIYQRHPEWVVLQAFFDECIAYWKDRPILEVDGRVPMATCMPRNTKLYIDSDLRIGVCEKMTDCNRIGNIHDGINWAAANSLVSRYYAKRAVRCAHCPAVRMCDLCLSAVDFSDGQFDALCHNERVYQRLHMLIFCEMAERGMLPLKQVPRLNAGHCELGEMTSTDIPVLREIVADHATQRFLPELCAIMQTDADIQQVLSTFRTYLQQGEGIMWGIRLGNTLIGFMALMELTTSSPTIFYALHPAHRGNGYMKECLARVFSYAEENGLAQRITTEVYDGNSASIAALMHNGAVIDSRNGNKTTLSRTIKQHIA